MQYLDYITLIAAIGFMCYVYAIRARGMFYITVFKIIPTIITVLLLFKFAVDIGVQVKLPS